MATARGGRDGTRSVRRLVGPRPSARRLLAPAGHIFVLSAFAVAQPLFYLFSRNAEFFTVRGSSPLDILVFALGILLLPTAVLLAVEGVAALVGERVWYAVHVVFVAALSVLILLPVLKRVDDQHGASLLVVAGLIGAGLAFAYVRLSSVRSFLTLLIPAPLIFAALFLFHSPVNRLVFVDDAPVRSSAVTTRIPIVFVVFDELSTVTLLDGSERINAKRFPNFAALADDATFYRDATTVHDFTEHAVPAILTGQLPAKDELPIYADHRQNLFTLLGKGYRMHVRETLTHLCPVSLCRPSAAEPLEKRLGSLVEDSSIVYLHVILPGALRERLPPVDRSWKSFRGMTIEDQEGKGNLGTLSCAPMCGLVKDFSLAHPASLYFRHIQTPHIPWRYLPSGKRYLGDTRSIPGLTLEREWADDAFLTTQAQERYFLQLGYADRALGIVLDKLHETGLYDPALVVVAADHGLSFQPGGPRRDITATNAHEIAFMPLFIKLPDQREGRIEDGFVRTVDILPTIADVLGLTIPQPVDGRSLLGRRPAPDGTVVIDGKTERIEEPLSELLRRREDTLRRQVEVFGGGGWNELYKSGPHPELVGRPLSDLDLGDAPGLTVELDGLALLNAYDPDSSLSPAYVLGRITGAPPGLDLAVGVNGLIVATTRTYESFGDARLAVFVPEASLRRGQNEIDVLAVRPDGGLERIEVAAPPLSLEGDEIRRADGTTLRPDGAVRGELDVERSQEKFVFSGWAVDRDRRRPVDSVAVFVDDRLVYVARGRAFRTITPQQHEGIAESGFRFALPRSLMPVGGSAHVVRVFAVSGDTAAELEYGPAYPWKHAAG